jgi:hypothetical protein
MLKYRMLIEQVVILYINFMHIVNNWPMSKSYTAKPSYLWLLTKSWGCQGKLAGRR